MILCHDSQDITNTIRPKREKIEYAQNPQSMIKIKINGMAAMQEYARYTHTHTHTQHAKDTQITSLKNITQERRKILHMWF